MVGMTNRTQITSKKGEAELFLHKYDLPKILIKNLEQRILQNIWLSTNQASGF